MGSNGDKGKSVDVSGVFDIHNIPYVVDAASLCDVG